MERTITLFYIPYTEKNKLWYKQFVGKTLNEIQFSDILCNFWVDFEIIERKIRDFTD
jgi:hypothetical protein